MSGNIGLNTYEEIFLYCSDLLASNPHCEYNHNAPFFLSTTVHNLQTSIRNSKVESKGQDINPKLLTQNKVQCHADRL